MPRLLLAAALITAAIPAAAQVPAQPVAVVDGTILDVTAIGRTRRVPDVATIRAGVVTQAPTAAAALTDNAARVGRVLAALKAAGVAPRDVQTATISLQPQYRYGENVPPAITGYGASNTVSVRFRDVAKSGTILDALVREGANQIDGPNLSIDAPDAAEDEARADAIAKARARAEVYARAAGLRVDRILSIGEGEGYQPPVAPPAIVAVRMEARAAPSTQLAAGEQDVTVSATVRFLLK